MAKRDTVTYDLKQGHKVVYRGTTNDPEQREQEHRDEGKRFSHMHATSRRMTEDGAKQREAEALETEDVLLDFLTGLPSLGQLAGKFSLFGLFET